MLIGKSDTHKLVRAQFCTRQQEVYCPGCQERVYLRSGEHRQPHFAHRQQCLYTSESESQSHLAGKQALYNALKDNYRCQLEYIIPEIKRRADLAVVTDNQIRVVEYQCSSLTFLEYRERTQNYHSLRYAPIWILGSTYHQHPTEQRMMQFMQSGAVPCYRSQTGQACLMANFNKVDFQKMTYQCYDVDIKKLLDYRFKTNQPKIHVNDIEQYNRLGQAMRRGQIPRSLALAVYEAGLYLLGAPWWIHAGHTFGLRCANWEFRVRLLLYVRRSVVSRKKLIRYLQTFFHPTLDSAYVRHMIADILRDLRCQNWLVSDLQAEDYRFQGPKWFASDRQKLAQRQWR